MATKLTPDWPRRILALLAAALVLLLPLAAMPILVIAAVAVIGLFLPAPPAAPISSFGRAPHPAAAVALIAFATLLIALPLLSAATHSPIIDIADRFYRTGSLVFGGGHVVLPLLETEFVATGLIDRDLFLAGYGAAQAVPGPLFSFAFYAGALLKDAPNGVWGGLLALGAIYLPTFLLVLGALPYWDRLRSNPRLRQSLELVNAAVVGLLVAALIDPVFLGSVFAPLDLAIAAAALAALWFRAPPWLVVLACGGLGAALTLLP